MTRKTVELDLNFATLSDVNLELLKILLESTLQGNVLPLLVGCRNEGPVSIENNIYLIENAVLRSVSIDNSTSCSSNAEETCSLVTSLVELFLRDAGNELLDQSVLDLIADLFQDEGLLELLKLGSAVTNVDFIQVVEVFPSLPPTSSPSIQELPLGVDRCQAIANGTRIAGQDTLSFLTYEVLLDVALSAQAELPLLSIELQRQLQAVILPALAGCDDVGQQQLETGLFEGGNMMIDGSCLPSSGTLCYRYLVYLEIFVDNALSSTDLVPAIREEFLNASSLVSRLDLAAPFERIAFVSVLARRISENPSANPTVMKSQSPTARPSLIPSVGPTMMPVVGPTLAPTSSPSSHPTLLPTAFPTPLSSLQPTISPTPRPTTLPTLFPSPQPSASPSLRPSASPSLHPSVIPSMSSFPSPRPSQFPSPEPSASPSLQPSVSPSVQCIQTNTQLQDAVNNWTSLDSVLKSAVEDQYGTIGDWCFGAGVTSMANLNEDISGWDVSGVTAMNGMFYNCIYFNQDLSSWDVSSVTAIWSMFNTAYRFNGNLSPWNVSSVTSMSSMFFMAHKFNQDISSWDVSSVTNMKRMFQSGFDFNQDISSWDVSSVTAMNYMFFRAKTFNQNISSWDVSSLNTMENMFREAYAFNGDMSSWDVSSVYRMDHTFEHASSFNGDISSWDVSGVGTMAFMFRNAPTFNQDISSWDVSSVTKMNNMFQDASAFNQNISSWEVSSVNRRDGMFSGVSSFDQDYSPWPP